MDEQTKKKLTKKLQRFTVPHHENYIGGAVFIVIGLLGAVAGVIEQSIEVTVGGVLLAVLLGGWLFSDGVKDTKRYKARLERIRQGGGFDLLLDDFQNGQRAFGGQLIIGRTFVIGKRTGSIFSYGEITRAYQYIVRTNGIESARTIRIVTPNDGTMDLCKLKLRGKSNDEVDLFMQHLLRVNPNVALGYNG